MGLDEAAHGRTESVANHSTASMSPSGTSSVQFGSENRPDREGAGDHLTHFFQMVDAGLAPVLAGTTLLLAGVEDEVLAYRRAAKYVKIATEGIHGSIEHWTLIEIADRAHQTSVHEYFAEAAKGLVTARAANALQDPRKILRAAIEGRVRLLFVREGPVLMSTVPPELKCSEDFVNAAVAETLCTGGEVFAVRAKEMPDTPAVAALRY